ncbi:hypothetical protein [Deinococcus aquatilis]|uniref:hypothetical protein n=1 Tax=Deinococcus aquatilis TaxID=519440 RepID=UPI00039C3CFA|nr:hypothetical protein [Deinococcus aquatilis]
MRLLEYPAHRPASAFLQCDSAEYLMLEFWGSGAAASALCDAAAAELGFRLDAFDGLPPPCIPDCAAASKP